MLHIYVCESWPVLQFILPLSIFFFFLLYQNAKHLDFAISFTKVALFIFIKLETGCCDWSSVKYVFELKKNNMLVFEYMEYYPAYVQDKIVCGTAVLFSFEGMIQVCCKRIQCVFCHLIKC